MITVDWKKFTAVLLLDGEPRQNPGTGHHAWPVELVDVAPRQNAEETIAALLI